jgi:FtsH-binding integral membrane protein
VASDLLARIGGQINLIKLGTALMGLGVSLWGGWIAAATSANKDVFMYPFWIFLILFVVGLAAWLVGASTTGSHMTEAAAREDAARATREEDATAWALRRPREDADEGWGGYVPPSPDIPPPMASYAEERPRASKWRSPLLSAVLILGAGLPAFYLLFYVLLTH